MPVTNRRSLWIGAGVLGAVAGVVAVVLPSQCHSTVVVGTRERLDLQRSLLNVGARAATVLGVSTSHPRGGRPAPR